MMPAGFHPTEDGDYILVGDDKDENIAEIRRHSPHDADAYERYHHDMDRVVQAVQPLFDNPPPNIFGKDPEEACQRTTREVWQIAERTGLGRARPPGPDAARHRADRTGRAPAPHPAGSRGRDPRQERVPRQHEPRAAHAPERGHRLQRAAAGGRGRADGRRTTSPTSQDRGAARTSRPDQRHPRSLEDRGGPHGGAHRELRLSRSSKSCRHHRRRSSARRAASSSVNSRAPRRRSTPTS